MPIDCSNLKGIENNLEISNYIKTIEFGDEVQHISATVAFENELKINTLNIQKTSDGYFYCCVDELTREAYYKELYNV